MILKSADDKHASLRQLEDILLTAALPARTRIAIEQEISSIRAGIRGESDTAFEIDFFLGKSKNTIVLHDLRLQADDGRVAQIDHVLIHRTNRIWVLETKHVSRGVKRRPY